jgi:hypothetical protein
MEWEVWIGGGQCGHKVVVFPRCNCLFGGIMVVLSWWYESKGYVVLGHEGLEFSRRFIVQILEYRLEARFGQISVELGIGAEQFAFIAGCQGLRQDCLRIVVIYNHDVFAVAARRDWESSGSVVINISRDFDRFHEYPMGSDSGSVVCRHHGGIVTGG